MTTENENKIQFAQKVVVCLAKSTFYDASTVHLDNELKRYFSVPKEFKLNDHFHLKSTLEPNVFYQFRIIEVEPKSLETFLIDNSRTTLIQNQNAIKDKWIWTQKKTNEILAKYTTELKSILKFYELFQKSSDTLPILLLHGPSGSGKTRCVESVCIDLNLHLCKINAINLAGESSSAVEKRVEIFMRQSLNYGPCIILIKSFHYLFKLKDINDFNKRIICSFFQLIQEFKSNRSSENFFIVCTTCSKQMIDFTISSYFDYELELKNLDDDERKLFIKNELGTGLNEQRVIELVKKTNGLFYGEMKTLCDLINSEFVLSDNHLENTLKKFYSRKKFKMENKLNVENIKWTDVGGLDSIKDIINDTILLPLKYPSLFVSNEKQLGITRSGILLYGPPGTGKTLLAKAISNECGLNFLSVKGPELLDMYVGQTEKNVRSLFEKARLNSPCILFFDELDSLAPIRGRAGDSGGVMDRVVSQLLTEIDGLDKYDTDKISQIFIIGATNRPDLIDSSLLRPGRFDKLVYVPIAKTFEERLNILKALTRKLPIESNFNHEKFLKACPNNLTGADFYALTNRARRNALKRIVEHFEANNLLYDDNLVQDDLITITEKDFLDGLLEFHPTLSESELIDYEKYFAKISNKS